MESIMPGHIGSARMQSALHFLRRSDGSVAPLLGLALIPIMGAVAAAVDYSRASGVKTALQAALDSAVIAGAKDGSANWSQTATNMFNANIAAKGSTVATPTFSFDGQNSYSGTVTASLPTAFRVLGFSSLSISAASVASGSQPDNSCILTLDGGQPRSDVSLTLNGAPVVSLTGCSIRSNTSMNCNGHNGNASASIAAGTVSARNNAENNAAVVPDIYSPLAGNITNQCGSSRIGATWTGGSSAPKTGVVTVSNNGYTEYHVCGDLTVTGTGYLTGSAPASDSLIIIENGSLSVADSAQISTARTAIILTGNNSYASAINFPNGKGHAASLSLSPPTSPGTWQGIALYQNPALTNSVDDTWGPGATFNVDGVAYLPHANMTMHGSGASNNYQCTKIVVNTFTTDGSVNLNFAQTSGCNTIGMKQWADVPLHLAQ
jgi:Flp pilus assembly protein TadG